MDCEVKNLLKKFCRCFGLVTFTKLSSTVDETAMILPQCTSCSPENPMGLWGSLVQEMCGVHELGRDALPGILLSKRVISMISALLQDDKSNSRGFHWGNLLLNNQK